MRQKQFDVFCRNNTSRRKAETGLFGATAAAGNGCNPRPRSHVRGGGFSHVAVRSCASRACGTFVREPRLLRPSITLTPRERQRGKPERGGRIGGGQGINGEKAKVDFKVSRGCFPSYFPCRFHFPQQKGSIYLSLFSVFELRNFFAL